MAEHTSQPYEHRGLSTQLWNTDDGMDILHATSSKKWDIDFLWRHHTGLWQVALWLERSEPSDYRPWTKLDRLCADINTRGSAELGLTVQHSNVLQFVLIYSYVEKRVQELAVANRSELNMAASTSSTSHPKSYTYFGDIPEEVRDMMLCHACNLQPFHKDNAIVLPCAHVMCLDCVSDRVSKTATRDKVECPKCAEEWTIPFGNIYAFPRDFFSLVLNNILQGKSHGMVRPNPKCAIHPKENVSRHCKQCSLTVRNTMLLFFSTFCLFRFLIYII